MKVTIQAASRPVRLSKQSTLAPGAITSVDDGPFIAQLIAWGDVTLVADQPQPPAQVAPATSTTTTTTSGGSK
jgi:hypothetical protein